MADRDRRHKDAGGGQGQRRLQGYMGEQRVTQAWPKAPWTDAGQVFAFIGGAIEHQGAADALGLPPGAYFETLIEAGRLRDAVHFVSHALPRYECVVWAAQSLLAAGAVDRGSALVVAVLCWIDDPCEELRRAVERLIEEETLSSPGYWLAKAVFVSGGSVSPPDCPPVLPSPAASAKFAAAAIFEAAAGSSRDSAGLLRHAASLGDALASQALQH